MYPTRVAEAVPIHGLSVVSGNHFSEYLLLANVKSVPLCRYERGPKKRHLQNTSVDQAHIAHNANRRLCELIMSSQYFPYRLGVGTCEWLAITQSQTLGLALVGRTVSSLTRRETMSSMSCSGSVAIVTEPSWTGPSTEVAEFTGHIGTEDGERMDGSWRLTCDHTPFPLFPPF